MGTDVGEPLVVPAWCDPESRNYRLSWADTLVGLLMIDDERIVFATPSGVKFNALRPESTLEWRRGKGFGMIPRFDLLTPQGSFRLYLSRPSTTAPLYGPSTVAEVGEQLSRAGDVLGALFGSLFPLIGGVGEFMLAREDYRQLRQGRDAAGALRARISSPPHEGPPAR
jgi:hypothetical protein